MSRWRRWFEQCTCPLMEEVVFQRRDVVIKRCECVTQRCEGVVERCEGIEGMTDVRTYDKLLNRTAAPLAILENLARFM